jgi:hypothetical protein
MPTTRRNQFTSNHECRLKLRDLFTKYASGFKSVRFFGPMGKDATAAGARALAICIYGLGPSRKSLIFSVYTGPLDIQILLKK